MSKYRVMWIQLMPVYHEREVEASGQNDAVRAVQKGDHGEKNILDVKLVKPEGDWD